MCLAEHCFNKRTVKTSDFLQVCSFKDLDCFRVTFQSSFLSAFCSVNRERHQCVVTMVTQEPLAGVIFLLLLGVGSTSWREELQRTLNLSFNVSAQLFKCTFLLQLHGHPANCSCSLSSCLSLSSGCPRVPAAPIRTVHVWL